MRLATILVLPIFLVSCSDKTPHEQPSSKTSSGAISTKQSNQASAAPDADQANAYRIGLSSFEIPFSQFLSHFQYETTKIEDAWLRVNKGKETLFSLSDKNDLRDKKVRMIEIYSPDIQTENGVHVGMDIKELVQKFPDQSLDYEEASSEECFYFPIGSTQVKTNASHNVRIVAYVSSNNGKELAKKGLKELTDNGAPWPYPTKDFSMEGTINKILILME